MRSFLSPDDLSVLEVDAVLERALQMKAAPPTPPPTGKRVGALFLAPSLRTRVSFAAAAEMAGASCQTINAGADSWALEMDPQAVMDGDKAECIVDAARVLGRYFHLLGARAFPGQDKWEVERREPVLSALARDAGIPVVSLEGALHHPCQSLADLLTVRERHGADIRGLPVALCWAWHPKALPAAVPHSFALQIAMAGADLALVHPKSHPLDGGVMAKVGAAAAAAGGEVAVHNDRAEGLAGRQIVYVKSWGRLEAWGTPGAVPATGLCEWLVDEAALAPAPEAKVMHCLPVRRGVVMAGSLLDGPRSLVTDQAENRLWAQGALLEFLLGEAS